MKLVTLVEVAPSLVLHEIPPRAGKCQTGRIGKFRGGEGEVSSINSASTEAGLRQRGTSFLGFVSHPPLPEAECGEHTQPLFIITGVRRPADQNIGALREPFVKHCPFTKKPLSRSLSPFLSLRSRFSPPFCFALARLRLLLSGRFPGCNHILLTAGWLLDGPSGAEMRAAFLTAGPGERRGESRPIPSVRRADLSSGVAASFPPFFLDCTLTSRRPGSRCSAWPENMLCSFLPGVSLPKGEVEESCWHTWLQMEPESQKN